MADYEQMTDEQLIGKLRQGDKNIIDYIMEKYKNLVRKEANAMYLLGGENDDLIQEGMIGLICAVREYDGQRAASFRTFAEICIRNRLYSAVRAASRDKHTPLNQSVPLEIPFFDGQSSCFGAMAGENPEDLIIGRERVQDALSDVRKQLSDFEAKILGYYLDGLTIREMAKAVCGPPNRWTTPCSASGARQRGSLTQAISAKAERNIFFSIQREGKIMYEDKTLVCKECGQEFVFTAGEQEFYAERGFQNEPQRCKACRDARKNAARAPP